MKNTKILLILFTLTFSISYSQCDANGDGVLDVLDIVVEVNCILDNCWEGGSVECIDIDGNSYETVQIGDQLWMAENLKVTHYNNGDEIPNITNNGDWSSLSTGAYCDYDNNPTNSDTYGRLYNWYAVDDDRGICPHTVREQAGLTI